jgi:hypothetical protein
LRRESSKARKVMTDDRDKDPVSTDSAIEHACATTSGRMYHYTSCLHPIMLSLAQQRHGNLWRSLHSEPFLPPPQPPSCGSARPQDFIPSNLHALLQIIRNHPMLSSSREPLRRNAFCGYGKIWARVRNSCTVKRVQEHTVKSSTVCFSPLQH